MSDESTPRVERYPCDRCGKEFAPVELNSIETHPRGEVRHLCDPCVDDTLDWIDSGVGS